MIILGCYLLFTGLVCYSLWRDGVSRKQFETRIDEKIRILDNNVARVNGFQKQCEELRTLVQGFNQTAADKYHDVCKDLEWIKLKASAPMTLILKQETPLKVLHKPVLRKIREQMEKINQ